MAYLNKKKWILWNLCRKNLACCSSSSASGQLDVPSCITFHPLTTSKGTDPTSSRSSLKCWQEKEGNNQTGTQVRQTLLERHRARRFPWLPTTMGKHFLLLKNQPRKVTRTRVTNNTQEIHIHLLATAESSFAWQYFQWPECFLDSLLNPNKTPLYS